MWFKATFKSESYEFMRVAMDIGPSEKQAIFSMLENLYKKAPVLALQETVWQRLENTDSFFVKSEANARKILKAYSRDLDSILKELRSDRIRCPIILKNKLSYTLVAGNTRLMGCRLVSLTPKVVILDPKL